MPEPKHVLTVIPKLFLGGGAEKVSLEQAAMFSDMGCRVSFFTFHQGDVHAAGYCANYGETTWHKLRGMFSIPTKLARYCYQNNIDVIISHTERANYIALLAAALLRNRVRVITVTHNHKYLAQRRHLLGIKLLYRRAYKNIAVSSGIEQGLQQRYALSNACTIYNPFDFEKITQKSNESIPRQDEHLLLTDKTTFINIGRLHEQKGQRFLITAFAQHHKSYPSSQLLILGDGPLRTQLASQIRACGMSDHIRLLGTRENVFPYLKQADCFVLSSIWEGLPTVLIEAMGVGIPIISTNCKTGPSEILPPNTQLINVEGDIVSELKDALSNIPRALPVQYNTQRFSRSVICTQWKHLLYGEIDQ